MAAFFGKTNVLRRTEVSTAQDEYSIDDNGPGYDPSARSVIRVPRRGKPGLLEPVYMFTGERPDPAKHPRPEFARMLTSDPQFARATVNLLWAEMFGVGIVEPVFAFDMARLDPKNPPPAPWALAADASGTARSARAVLPRQQLQHPIGGEADRQVQCLSALVAVPRRVEGRATPRTSRASSCAG